MLVAAAVQVPGGETGQEVRGRGGQERTESSVEPQLDEGGVVQFGVVDGVQS